MERREKRALRPRIVRPVRTPFAYIADEVEDEDEDMFGHNHLNHNFLGVNQNLEIEEQRVERRQYVGLEDGNSDGGDVEDEGIE